MVQCANFLLRWLFLCRLVDDRTEVQTWPYRRPGYYGEGHQGQGGGVHHHQNQHHHQDRYHRQHDEVDVDVMDMPAYREYVVRSLTSYPPGSNDRLLRLEELRLEVVNEFASGLAHADAIVGRRGQGQGEGGRRKRRRGGGGDDDEYDDDATVVTNRDDDDDEVHRDASMRDDFADLFDARMRRPRSVEDISQTIRHEGPFYDYHRDAGDEDRRRRDPAGGGIHDVDSSSADDIVDARRLLDDAREYLPQLVSTVLHSPPSPLSHQYHHHHQYHDQRGVVFRYYDQRGPPHQPDPISSLRSLLIERCRSDPSLGIELCWLLEAEVGRKWKALFEHRQRTGRRLILIVQADIAAAIATIGAERASAFNLLQDAETATAFGVDRRYEDVTGSDGNFRDDMHTTTTTTSSYYSSHSRGGGGGGPPKAISDLRCRHFGDSMHLIDRLTQISLDLRLVPHIHRQYHLTTRLYELNRRLCRRMFTRGRISLDVDEDMSQQQQPHNNYHHPYGGHHAYSVPPRWSEEDVREDMIRHSVHLPFEPRCARGWPGGNPTGDYPNDDDRIDGCDHDPIADRGRRGVVRALRILPENCRLLSSATRCPFLVRMEVVETGLDADDARLYVPSEGGGVGLTVQETLGSLRSQWGNPVLGDVAGLVNEDDMAGAGGFVPCEIPPELMMTTKGGDAGRGGGAQPRRGTESAAPSWKKDDAPEVMQVDRDDDDRVRYAFESPPRDSPRSQYADVIPPPHSGFASVEESKAVVSRGGGYHGAGGYGYDLSPPDAFDMVGGHYYEELRHDLRQQHEGEFNSPNPSSMMGTVGPSPQQLSSGSALLDNVFGRPWNVECENIRLQSPYRNIKGWKLASFIIKAGEDIRREALVMQCMTKLWTWFQEEIPPHLRPFLRPYTIRCIGGDAGIVECLPDVKSINEVKKETDGFTTLRDFFVRAYGPPLQTPFRSDHPQQPSTPNSFGAVSFEKARDNFLRSLVGYSVVCYILQIKDRHNANILLDREGHIMHIDFGFVLGETPKMGKVPLFSERAPFKLSAEFWEVIGGWRSFKQFCEMFEAAYAVAAAHSDEICSLVEAAIMNVSRNTDLSRSIADSVRGRMQMKADPKEQKLHIMNIVNDAITSWGTSTYDWLQRSMHGYQ